MIKLVKVLSFIVLFVAGGFSKNLQASNLLNHVSEKHISHHEHSDNHHHDEHNKANDDGKNHDHSLEFSLIIQAVNVEEKMEVIQDLFLFKVVRSIPLFVPQIHLSNYTSSLFRPPIS
ncbi:MAG: hypothetical protein ACLGHN_12380 [Bacteriovoracia bacterium]